MRNYLDGLIGGLRQALDYSDAVELHGAPGNAWRVPLMDGPRPHGNIQSEVELQALAWGFVVMVKPRLVIETGCDVGAMTRALGCAVQANGFGRVLGAEIDPGRAERARAFCAGLPVEIRCCPALELPIHEADFLFLDSSYESRVAELALVKPGAIAILHDTCREPAMGAEAEKYARSIRITTPRGCALIQK